MRSARRSAAFRTTCSAAPPWTRQTVPPRIGARRHGLPVREERAEQPKRAAGDSFMGSALHGSPGNRPRTPVAVEVASSHTSRDPPNTPGAELVGGKVNDQVGLSTSGLYL
jgi:hypothetical protein